MRPNCLVDWKRKTALLLDSVAIAASHTPDRQPVSASKVRVSVTGSPTGLLTVQGIVSGVLDEESLTWDGSPMSYETDRSFSALNTILSGLSGGALIEASAIDSGGHPRHGLVTIKSGHPISLNDAQARRWQSPSQGEGSEYDAVATVDYEEVWRPRKGDVVSVLTTGEHYEVVGVKQDSGDLYGGFQPWVCRLKRKQGIAS